MLSPILLTGWEALRFWFVRLLVRACMRVRSFGSVLRRPTLRRLLVIIFDKYCNMSTEINCSVVLTLMVGHTWAVLKGLNYSSCCFECGLEWAQETEFQVWVRIPPREGAFVEEFPSPAWSIDNIWRESKLFVTWRQRCGLSLPALQQLVIDITSQLRMHCIDADCRCRVQTLWTVRLCVFMTICWSWPCALHRRLNRLRGTATM